MNFMFLNTFGFDCSVGLDGISMHTILVLASSCKDKNTFYSHSPTETLERGTIFADVPQRSSQSSSISFRLKIQC